MYYEDTSSIIGAIALIMWGVVLISLLINYVLTVYPLYIMFKRANLRNYKIALIPIINYLKLFNLADVSAWWTVVLFVPFLGPLMFLILMSYVKFKISENFGLNTLISIIAIYVPFIVFWYIALTNKRFIAILNPKYQYQYCN